jgi:hypothetical protein
MVDGCGEKEGILLHKRGRENGVPVESNFPLLSLSLITHIFLSHDLNKCCHFHLEYHSRRIHWWLRNVYFLCYGGIEARYNYHGESVRFLHSHRNSHVPLLLLLVLLLLLLLF